MPPHNLYQSWSGTQTQIIPSGNCDRLWQCQQWEIQPMYKKEEAISENSCGLMGSITWVLSDISTPYQIPTSALVPYQREMCLSFLSQIGTVLPTRRGHDCVRYWYPLVNIIAAYWLMLIPSTAYKNDRPHSVAKWWLHLTSVPGHCPASTWLADGPTIHHFTGSRPSYTELDQYMRLKLPCGWPFAVSACWQMVGEWQETKQA